MEQKLVHRPKFRSEHSIFQFEIGIVPDYLCCFTLFIRRVNVEVKIWLSSARIASHVLAFSDVKAIYIVVMLSRKGQRNIAFI